MKLERIVLTNFRQYFGRQRLNFSRDAKKNVTVIHGANGAGKTSLFVALNWCLYGEGAENIGELISKEAIRITDAGKPIESAVEVSFHHEGERFLAKRRLTATKQSDSAASSTTKEEFSLTRIRSDGQAEEVKSPIGTMNAVLPANVRTYFLFDGEKIDNFAKPQASQEVRYAIYNVLKLEVLDRAQVHLMEVAAELRRELRQAAKGLLRSLVEDEEKKREERNQANKRKGELQREKDLAQGHIKDIDQRLRELQGAKDLQERRDRVQRDLERYETEQQQVTTQIRELANRGSPLFAAAAADLALQILDGSRARGEIPSNIRSQFLKDLLERRRCICGRQFDQGDPAERELERLLKSTIPSSLEDDVVDTSAALRLVPERLELLGADLQAAMQRRADLKVIAEQLYAEKDDIGRQLKGASQEEIAKLERRRQEYQADVESHLMEIGHLIIQLGQLDQEISELAESIKEARKDERREQVLAEKVKLAQDAADAVRSIYETFAENMRQRIEAKTKEIFKGLVWKDSHFQDVRLEQNYMLEVIDRFGMPARPELSAGERQVLSLSFITAMSKVAQESVDVEAPLVMDTPFGRLSSAHRESITANIPALAPQLVLFVTDEELREKARENLEPRIGAEYRLTFNGATSCTTIEEIG